MNYDREQAMMEILVDNDLDIIFNSSGGIEYLRDILMDKYMTVSHIELQDEFEVRGLEMPPYLEDL
jgi:hypothetical protein